MNSFRSCHRRGLSKGLRDDYGGSRHVGTPGELLPGSDAGQLVPQKMYRSKIYMYIYLYIIFVNLWNSFTEIKIVIAYVNALKENMLKRASGSCCRAPTACTRG